MTSAAGRALPATAVPVLDSGVRTHRCDVVRSVRSYRAGFHRRLMIGKLLGGRYRLERELGEGGMGVVYLARDEQIDGETFAIKVMKEPPHPGLLTLLRQEVGRTRRLSHPNIVDVHSVNLDDGRLYVLMEYLEGKPLNSLVHEEFGRGMSFSRAWPIIEDVGAALGCAHDHNVVHSDLKLANVFMATSGRAKLLDFGIARVARSPLRCNGAGLQALTPVYASCEMLEGQEADRRDDLYSFACLIYEMLSGDRPFGDLTALEAREARAGVPPLAGLSVRQNAAIARALAFQREARTGSVEELLAGLGSHATPPARKMAVLAGVISAVIATLCLTSLDVAKPWLLRGARPAVGTTAVDFNPPPHSIAVLPFVNMSGDSEQNIFSQGLTEELLNSLTRVNELQVAGRTSSFSFKGEHPDIVTVGQKLNVASVLEGSVRRSRNRLRVTVQLNDAVTGFHLWSQTYDRDLGDILKLQTDIANAVADTLKVRLLGTLSERIELGGTRNLAAFDRYLRGSKSLASLTAPDVYQAAIDQYAEAIRLDPHYALAFAGRSRAYTSYAASGAVMRGFFENARADAREAIRLAPGLAEGHMALGFYFEFGALDFGQARAAYDRARALAPGNAKVLRTSASFLFTMGQFDEGVSAARRAVALDPLNRTSYDTLGFGLYLGRRYGEAIRAYAESITVDPAHQEAYGVRGLAYYALHDYQNARSSCETKSDDWVSQQCLAVVYNKLGRHADAETVLAKYRSTNGNGGAYQYATIYAQWGNTPKALEWLDVAVRLRDPGLELLKNDPLMDTLRKEPRFQAIQRGVGFPE